MCSVPPHIYNFPSVTVAEGESSKLVCLSHGDPSPDLTFHRTGHTDVYRIGTNVCSFFLLILTSLQHQMFEILLSHASHVSLEMTPLVLEQCTAGAVLTADSEGLQHM